MNTNLETFSSQRWSPWREFASLQKRLDNLMQDVPSDSSFVPACDVSETENEVVITMDVPGIPKEAIQVQLNGNTLVVSGERKSEEEHSKGKRKTYERFHGTFERSFFVPESTDPSKVNADYSNGVLKISFPKISAQSPRQIPINDGKKTAKPGETRAA
jgi:HSP20 family protein